MTYGLLNPFQFKQTGPYLLEELSDLTFGPVATDGFGNNWPFAVDRIRGYHYQFYIEQRDVEYVSVIDIATNKEISRVLIPCDEFFDYEVLALYNGTAINPTLNSVSIGRPHPNRHILAVISAANATASSLTEVKFGTYTGYEAVKHLVSSSEYLGAWIAKVPLGTSISIMLTSTFDLWTVQLYRLNNLISHVPFDTAIGNPLVLDIPVNGICLLAGNRTSINEDPIQNVLSNVYNHRNNMYTQGLGDFGIFSSYGLRSSIPGISLSSTISGSPDKAIAISFQTKGQMLAPIAPINTDWYALDSGTSSKITIVLVKQPLARGSIITGFEWQVDGGAWNSLGGVNPTDRFSHFPYNGVYEISGLTNGVPVNLAIRAVSDAGPGPTSDIKTITPTADGTWTHLGSIEGVTNQTATVTVNNVPIGPDNPNRYILISIGWSKFGVGGTHGVGTMTLGGVSGLRVARAFNGNDSHNVEQWKFPLGAISGSTATLIFTKTGGVNNPWWNYLIGSFYHVSDAGGPTLLASHPVYQGVASITTTIPGDVVAQYCQRTWTGVPFFASNLPNYSVPVLSRMSNSFSLQTYFESILGYHTARAPSVISVDQFQSTSSFLATVWTRVQTVPTNLIVPLIDGDPRVGETLTIDDGTWEVGHLPDSITYQWKANGIDIPGATSNSFVITSSEIGATITCLVTATNSAGSTPITSAATIAVTVGDPYFSLVSGLLHFDGADGSTVMTDIKGNIWTVVGGAKLTTAQSVFGGSSLALNGAGDYIHTPNHVKWQVAGGDFFIEARIQTTIAKTNTISSKRDASGAEEYDFRAGGTTIGGATYAVGAALGDVSGAGITLSNWYQAAFGRRGNTYYIFIDGILKGTHTIAGAASVNTGAHYIGRNAYDTTRDYQGFIDDYRFTKGRCRHIRDYVVLNEPFPDS